MGTVVLALGAFAGVIVGGRKSAARPMRLLVPGGLALLVGWTLFTAAAGTMVATFLLVFVRGVLSFTVRSTLIAQALYADTEVPSLGGTFATAPLNVGAALGPSIGAGFDHRPPRWVSARCWSP
ncbi:Cmx [Streptomyces sp. NBC_01431]|uniref:Cmx n=1 Tax=Streptomyces sp. NBC_01431 TaxID=2903863 RepID=UPI002E36B576|nr:Cmx [Streptomyces sp. NBC_01431]